MLDNLKKAGKAVSSVNDARQQQAKLQALLTEIQVTGYSKNKKVAYTVRGDQTFVKIEIEPALIKFVYENFIANDKPDTILSKSIAEAVDDAMSKVQGEVVKKIQESGSMGDLMSMLQAANGGK